MASLLSEWSRMAEGMGSLTNNGALWTYEDHIIAFNLYCQLPFGRLHQTNPKIIELADLLGRTPDSVAMKLCNFASLDPSLQKRGIRGLKSASKGVEQVWGEFGREPERLAFESECLLANRLGRPVEQVSGVEVRDLPPPGTERDAIVRVRVNQRFFRRRIISAFEFRCCVTGLAVPDLLVASHIVPWASDAANRLNPRNGLCLNALHDRAFDRGLMWIEEGFIVRFSPRLSASRTGDKEGFAWLTRYDGHHLRLPRKFTPDPDLLRRHRDSVAVASV